VSSRILSTPLKWVMENLHRELMNRKREVELQDNGDCSAQGSRKRKKVIPFDTDGEFSKPEEGKNPEKSPKKPVKNKSPIKVKMEINEGMQEVQGPDMTMSKRDEEKTSSKPPLIRQISTVPEEPVTTAKGLAGKESEEGKL
jgi:hypothetical protein